MSAQITKVLARELPE